MFPLDRAAFHIINSWPDGLDPMFRFFSNGIHGIALKVALAILIVAMLVRGGKPRDAVVQALIATGLANTLTNVLKSGLQWNRPCVDLADIYLRTDKLTSFGTASAHSANMAAVATIWVLRLGPKWGCLWMAVALLTGLSRIYMGLHYPSQVLFGWACGIGMGLFVAKGWDFILLHRSNVSISNGDPDIDTDFEA